MGCSEVVGTNKINISLPHFGAHMCILGAISMVMHCLYGHKNGPFENFAMKTLMNFALLLNPFFLNNFILVLIFIKNNNCPHTLD